MKFPLIGLSIAFCLGIITAAHLIIPFFCFFTGVLLSLAISIIFIKQNKKFNIFILFTAFFLGAVLLSNSQILPDCHIVKIFPHGDDSVFLIGVIDNDPVFQGDRISFILKAQELGANKVWQKTCGEVLVKAYFSEEYKFSYGDQLILEGRLSRPFSFSKGFNYREYLKHQGIYCIFSVRKNSMIKELGKNAGNPLKLFSFRLKHRLKGVIVKNLSAFSAGILNALILGDREGLPESLLDTLMNLGTIHIIAISGFNVGIVAFIILLILKIVKIPRKPRYFFAVVLLLVYCVLTGASPPVTRATVMAVIFLCAYFLGREVNIYNSLSIATVIILAFNPWQIFEISFQLSFLSVISIVWLTPKIKSLFPEKLDKIKWLSFLILTFSGSSAAWIGLMPLIAYYFKTFTTITVLANMIIVPYSAIITITGFSFALIGALFPSWVQIFAATNELLILILVKIHYFLIGIPCAYFKLPEVPFIYAVIYYALVLFIFNAAHLKRFRAI